MSKRKFKRSRTTQNQKAKQPKWPLLTEWPIEPDIPANDLFAYRSPEHPGEMEWILEDFIFRLESGYYLQWEAVISREQGLRLTAEQKEALDALLYFGGDPHDRILYINEVPRPKKAWYTVAGQLAPRMVRRPYRTFEIMYSIYGEEGWPRLVEAINEHGRYLSLPAGIDAPLDIFPLELQHTLWLQICFDQLYGLGQEEGLTLAEQPDRVEEFIYDLRQRKDTVQYFNLTLTSLLTRVILPPADEALFIPMMMEQLDLPSPQAPLADYL